MRASRAAPLTLLLLTACPVSSPPAPPPAAPLPACTSCHPAQFAALAGSHHAKGQRPAGALPVGRAGPFELTAAHDGDGTQLRWREADGGVSAGPVRYTLGVEPLVQLAVELPDGRVQVPPVALVDGGWVEVPTSLSGAAGDWRGPAFSWNGSCAPCHATGFVVGARDGGFTSRWADLAVTCAACHGDEQGHLAWLRAGKPSRPGSGFALALANRTSFTFPADGGAIARPGEARPDVQTEVCAACHARRRALSDDGVAAGRLFERFEPALIDRGLYEANGAVLDEVYEVGSFLQSPMHRAGVRCTDCHEPHAATLRAPGEQVCARCHRPEVFAAATHGGPEGTCLDCHMPRRRFMGHDERRDHFIRRRPAGGEAFTAAFEERGDATRSLAALAADGAAPSFQRASALALLREPAPDALRAAARSDDAWLRYGAASALPSLPPVVRAELGARLLSDPLRAIRVRAGRALIGVVPLAPTLVRELEEAEAANAFRGDAWLNLGTLAAAQGDPTLAEQRWRHGLTVDPAFAPLTINLADLLRVTGRDAEGRALLEHARQTPGPWDSALSYALGLARWRSGDRPGALAAFRDAKRDGAVDHLQAWCLAERELNGPVAGAKALGEALRLHPDAPPLRALAR